MTGHHHDRGAAPSVPGLISWAWLSVAAAVMTIGLKSAAYLLTGSVGLLSDALESVVNLVAALLALLALRIAARPADENHPFGHGKVEYLSAGAEGMMIVIAAALIIYTSISRLLTPEPLEDLGVGLAITAVATVINGIVGVLVLRAGRRHRSIALEADGQHLLTDVWTSAGVLVGVAIVALTGWVAIDSLVALAVAANILWIGGRLVWSAIDGLLDRSADDDDLAALTAGIERVLRNHPPAQVHGLQTRMAGRTIHVSMHVLVPGDWRVDAGHDVLEEMEHACREAVVGAVVHTHIEPLEDPRSYGDVTGVSVAPASELPSRQVDGIDG